MYSIKDKDCKSSLYFLAIFLRINKNLSIALN